MSKPTLLVTGATGEIGRWLVLHLLRDGHQVAAMARHPAVAVKMLDAWLARHDMASDNLHWITGDIDQADLGLASSDRAQLDDVRFVYHLAARFGWGLDATSAHRSNVVGAEAAFDLARSLPKLEGFVQCSGYMADSAENLRQLGIEHGGGVAPCRNFTPDIEHRLYQQRGAYEASKLIQDFRMRQLAQQHGVPLTIINPATIIGDARDGELGQMLGVAGLVEQLWRGMLSAVPGKAQDWFPLVPVDYVGAFMARVPFLAQARNASFTLLDQSTPRLKPLVGFIADHIGVKAPQSHIPVGLLRALLKLGLDKITGATPETLDFLVDYKFDTATADQAAAAIGLTMPPLFPVVAKTVDHLIAKRFGAAVPQLSSRAGYHKISGAPNFQITRDETKPARLILLHGLPLDANSWLPMLQHLDAPALAPDMPQLGRNRARPDAVRWMDGVLAQADTKPILVGHSLGCLYALRAAARHPDRIGAVVLISPFFLQKQAPWVARAPLLGPLVFGAVTAGLIRDLPGDAEARESAAFSAAKPGGKTAMAHALRGATRPLVSKELKDILQNLRIPVLILHGEQDALVTQPAGVAVECIPEAGHHPQLSHPALIAGHIARFMAA